MPAERAERYRGGIGKELTFGIRPEHVTEAKNGRRTAPSSPRARRGRADGQRDDGVLHVGGTEVCARVEPSSVPQPGEAMRLYANLNHMHLIDPDTRLVL